MKNKYNYVVLNYALIKIHFLQNTHSSTVFSQFKAKISDNYNV